MHWWEIPRLNVEKHFAHTLTDVGAEFVEEETKCGLPEETRLGIGITFVVEPQAIFFGTADAMRQTEHEQFSSNVDDRVGNPILE